MKTYS